jgi:FKBP-type peptidyl-prolyl cis-trans isomerase FklB
MRNPIVFSTVVFLAGTFLCGKSEAQQSPAQTSSQTPIPSTSQTPAAKSGTAPGTKNSTSAQKTTTPAKKTPPPLELKTDKDKQSYAIGMSIAKSLQNQSKYVDLDPKILEQGLKDSLSGGKTLLTEEEMRTTLTALQVLVRQKAQEMQAQLQKEMQEKAEANKKAGDEFLATNKTKEGVVSLADGLQYKVLTEGTGPKPTASDTVECNYRGTLIDGTEFDSSYKRGQPLTIGVSGAIKGWTEALQMMPVGSKWELYVPSDLAYGPRNAGPQIGPNSTLVFQIELLSIKPKPVAASPATPLTPGTAATTPAAAIPAPATSGAATTPTSQPTTPAGATQPEQPAASATPKPNSPSTPKD